MSYFDGILSEMHLLHEAKQADYVGDNPDTLASFRASASLLNVTVPQLILGRCMDKVIRMSILLKRTDYNPAVKDESVRDTALDLATYGALLVEAIDDQVSANKIKTINGGRIKTYPVDEVVDSTDCYRIPKVDAQCDCRDCVEDREWESLHGQQV